MLPVLGTVQAKHHAGIIPVLMQCTPHTTGVPYFSLADTPTHTRSNTHTHTQTHPHSSYGEGPRLLRPLGGGKQWELVAAHTSPLVLDVTDINVEVGDLIGAGSFGKVFQGR